VFLRPHPQSDSHRQKSHQAMSSKHPPPPEEDAREWLLFDIESQDPITANFLKPTSSPPKPLPVLPSITRTLIKQTNQTFPSYRDEEEEDILDEEVDRPLISRGGLLTEMEAPYVAEAERLERFDSGGDGRRYDIIKLPNIGGGIINSIINMSNSIIGAGIQEWRARLMVGIIGLPYAFNRAGLVLGIGLLFSLTGVVDWTIR
jgi:hypothetical protein